MSRVLVTGGPGFIGRRVVQRFLSAGWDVTSFSLPGEAASPEWSGPVRMAYGDLLEAASVEEAASGASLAIHLAAVVGLAGEYDRQWDIIAEGTRTVCKAMAGNKGRAVVVSSIAVYGDLIQRQMCHEDDGFGAWQGSYGRAKQGQEQIAQAIAGRMNMPLTLVRPANVYGLGGASAWGERLLDWIATSGGAVIGDAERNNAGLVHIDNLTEALFLAGTHDRAVGQTFNVCDQNDVTWRRFIDDMAALIDKPPPPALPLDAIMAQALANEDPARCIGPKDPAIPSLEGLNLVGFDNRIDSSRLRAELGWVPRIGYSQAFAEMRVQLANKDTTA